MIYLTTGANGAGKTLITLKDVRDQQLKENRPVYFHGFDLDPAKQAEFGWQPFDPKKWQDLPDGSICIMDECQNEFPLRRSGAEVPDYINAIAQHRRRRGFDFWMICPHPSLLDVFVRRLIGKPSFHRHLKRTMGADVVSVITFGSPDLKCEEPGAGGRGEVTMRAYPKEVYSWYRSASLHTGKKRIPRALWVAVAAAVVVPVVGVMAFGMLSGIGGKKKAVEPVAVVSSLPALQPAVQRQSGPIDADEYLRLRKARIRDFPHTAPAYDGVTAPKVAPYPAACIHMGNECKCYTQQATLLQVSAQVCMQIVKNGYFVDWQEPSKEQQPFAQPIPLASPTYAPTPEMMASSGRAVVPPTSVPVPSGRSNPHADARHEGYLERLERQNSQVRSVLKR